MAKSHERGRLTDDEYAAYAPQTLTFDRKEATFTEKQCLEWVKTMAPPKPEPEAQPEMEEADGEGDGAFSGKRLRRLFTHATRRTSAPALARRRRRPRPRRRRREAGRRAHPPVADDPAKGLRMRSAGGGRGGVIVTATRAEASSFDRWLRNPYPVASGFSFPVGDGEGGGAYTDPAGHRYEGWYVATHLGDEYALGSTPARTGTGAAAATPISASR